MTLQITIHKQLGALDLDIALDAGKGLTALFGRSGSGKTSILNMVAGLSRPDRGRIVLDDHVLVDTQARLETPMHRRRIGYVFQEARLFPHLTVRQNLSFGRWFAPRGERSENVPAIVAMLGIEALLDRKPTALSGGEKQRVAIGRALLCAPRLLLMDEPLTALDDERKLEILPYIERLRDAMQVPILYVTHSLAEVSRLADSVALVRDGRIAAHGPPGDILHRPDLIGAEHGGGTGAVIEASVAEQDAANGLTVLACPAGTLYVPQIALPSGARVRLRIQARDVMLALKPPEQISALNVMAGRIVSLDQPGPGGVTVSLDCGGSTIYALLTRKSVQALALAPGLAAYAILKSVALDSSLVGAAPHAASPDTADATFYNSPPGR